MSIDGERDVDPGVTRSTLLNGVRLRQDRAWERLVELYGPLVYSWCRQENCQPGDAGDIVQDVFIAVATNIERLRRDRPGDSFRAWLRTITRNKAIDHLRAVQKRPVAHGGTDANERYHAVAQSGESVDGEADADRVRADLLSRALQMVKSDFEESTWRAFWMSMVDGESTAWIAEKLDMKPNAVRQARFRVVRRLRDEFGELLG